ncbi:ParB/RepB/Spo0J family partition protein [Paraburkholderia fungorum]|uniref:ParB/RepB/Spo0J family partition protein n=1 Tax=Paraburkholderia fungorum TaxID=134537 RepID=UPI0020927B70|nr:ParB N-terminal domain-containing protein [Paraburkholderia fungorum]USU18506.1 ParB/RepB/Spo0J family partition protein [Paraburkholderia fungorum]USU26431.1 ParB/RepB/Spo0J family partition protein [Paraburkholderia fungorum]
MSSKLKERLMARTAGVAERAESAAAARPPDGQLRASTMPAQLGAFRLEAREYQERIQQLQEQLEAAKRNGKGSMKVPLSDLHEVPGRRRYKSPEAYVELRENLRHNELMTPVAIRPRVEGGFEIVSGHWRTDSYRELERAEIDCVLSDSTEDQAALGAFYANLLQSDLTDYEKYLGFKDIRQRFPEITQAKMAEQAGVGESVVSALMAFDDLPIEVLALLNEKPSLMGATSGYALARLVRTGKADRVVLAAQRLANKELDEGQAVKFASADPSKQKAPPIASSFKIRAGRVTYCDVRQAKNVVRLEFQSEAEAQAVQSALKEVLEKRAVAAQDAQTSSEEK